MQLTLAHDGFPAVLLYVLDEILGIQKAGRWGERRPTDMTEKTTAQLNKSYSGIRMDGRVHGLGMNCIFWFYGPRCSGPRRDLFINHPLPSTFARKLSNAQSRSTYRSPMSSSVSLSSRGVVKSVINVWSGVARVICWRSRFVILVKDSSHVLNTSSMSFRSFSE